MRVIVRLGLCCLLLLSSPLLLAQPASSSHPDVRVIFDVSGSMKDNDPDQLSASALELLVTLLPSGVHGGLWTFGESVDNPVPVGPVDSQWRRQALQVAPALAEYQQFTDIEEAVRQASNSSGEGRRHLILLTDGRIDLPGTTSGQAARNAESRRRLLDELAPRLAEQGVVIHAIAFSPDADLTMVEQLGHATDGLATVVETPETLLRAFLGIFERIFPVDQVPFEGGRFTIDPEVESFSALLFHDPESPPLTLIDPEGRRYRADDHPEGMHWQNESRFDLITIPDPREGEWRVEGEFSADSRISVDSSLALRTSELPATHYLDFDLPLSAWLVRDGAPLTAKALPGDLRVRAELRGLDGAVQSGVALEEDNGRFEGVLPAPSVTGNASLVVDADSAEFQRQQVQAMNVLPAISANLGRRAREVILSAEHPRLDTENTRPHAELQGESLEVDTAGERRWRVDLPSLDPDISVPLLLSATITLDGQTREIRLPRLMLNTDAQIGLGEARIEGMQAERLPETPAADPDSKPEEEVQADLAVRIGLAINALPRQAQSLWREVQPGVERLARTHGDDLRLWVLIAGAALLMMVLVLWRRANRRRRRRRHVEEPHV
ncbi:VWA domain-containing protein [Litchfieldella rifensis]|uniref:VWA domain-containing protein n=1 Tax=Litchfieldella rifensis TaxID=762643 RepID=A0ABV7LML6_9GAMM